MDSVRRLIWSKPADGVGVMLDWHVELIENHVKPAMALAGSTVPPALPDHVFAETVCDDIEQPDVAIYGQWGDGDHVYLCNPSIDGCSDDLEACLLNDDDTLNRLPPLYIQRLWVAFRKLVLDEGPRVLPEVRPVDDAELMSTFREFCYNADVNGLSAQSLDQLREAVVDRRVSNSFGDGLEHDYAESGTVYIGDPINEMDEAACLSELGVGYVAYEDWFKRYPEPDAPKPVRPGDDDEHEIAIDIAYDAFDVDVLWQTLADLNEYQVWFKLIMRNGPGGGNPYVNLRGKVKDLRRWLNEKHMIGEPDECEFLLWGESAESSDSANGGGK